jgi:toxin YoeB
MVRKVTFAPDAITQIQKFKTGQQKLAFRIFEILEDIQKTPFEGLGKPEPLKGNLKGFWSRRIDKEHRLVYQVKADEIEVISCFGHYS